MRMPPLEAAVLAVMWTMSHLFWHVVSPDPDDGAFWAGSMVMLAVLTSVTIWGDWKERRIVREMNRRLKEES